MARKHGRRGGGFTVVELLVVVGVIAILMGILLPAVGMVQRSARAEASKSNLRQWGIGTIGYINLNKESLPWEGMKDAVDMPLNLAQSRFWANAVPPFVGQKSYTEIVEECYAQQKDVPTVDGGSIFVDPAAIPDGDAPYGFGPPGESGWRKQFYFNYVPNSQLNNTFLSRFGIQQYSPDKVMRMAQITSPSATILMVEMRANRAELPPTDPHASRDLKRHRADWKRFAARHFKGGHLMFADGHVDHAVNAEVITNTQGTQNPSEPNGDWNHPERIWDPLGPAIDE